MLTFPDSRVFTNKNLPKEEWPELARHWELHPHSKSFVIPLAGYIGRENKQKMRQVFGEELNKLKQGSCNRSNTGVTFVAANGETVNLKYKYTCTPDKACLVRAPPIHLPKAFTLPLPRPSPLGPAPTAAHIPTQTPNPTAVEGLDSCGGRGRG